MNSKIFSRWDVSKLCKNEDLQFVQIPDVILQALFEQKRFPYLTQLISVYIDLFRGARSYDNKRDWAGDLGMSPRTIHSCIIKLCDMGLVQGTRFSQNGTIHLELTFPVESREHSRVQCTESNKSEVPENASEISGNASEISGNASEILVDDSDDEEIEFESDFEDDSITSLESSLESYNNSSREDFYGNELRAGDKRILNQVEELEMDLNGRPYVTVFSRGGQYEFYLEDLQEYCYWQNGIRKGVLDTERIRNPNAFIISVFRKTFEMDVTDFVEYRNRKYDKKRKSDLEKEIEDKKKRHEKYIEDKIEELKERGEYESIYGKYEEEEREKAKTDAFMQSREGGSFPFWLSCKVNARIKEMIEEK